MRGPQCCFSTYYICIYIHIQKGKKKRASCLISFLRPLASSRPSIMLPMLRRCDLLCRLVVAEMRSVRSVGRRVSSESRADPFHSLSLPAAEAGGESVASKSGGEAAQESRHVLLLLLLLLLTCERRTVAVSSSLPLARAAAGGLRSCCCCYVLFKRARHGGVASWWWSSRRRGPPTRLL